LKACEESPVATATHGRAAAPRAGPGRRVPATARTVLYREMLLVPPVPNEKAKDQGN